MLQSFVFLISLVEQAQQAQQHTEREGKARERKSFFRPVSATALCYENASIKTRGSQFSFRFTSRKDLSPNKLPFLRKTARRSPRKKSPRSELEHQLWRILAPVETGHPCRCISAVDHMQHIFNQGKSTSKLVFSCTRDCFPLLLTFFQRWKLQSISWNLEPLRFSGLPHTRLRVKTDNIRHR